MRMPLGPQGPLFPSRGFPSTPLDLESNMLNWRDSFINKYQDTIRDVSKHMIHPDIYKKYASVLRSDRLGLWSNLKPLDLKSCIIRIHFYPLNVGFL